MNERFEVKRVVNEMIGKGKSDETTRKMLQERLLELKSQPTQIIKPVNPFDQIMYELDEEGNTDVASNQSTIYDRKTTT
jgi:hypothetical protein